MGIETFLLLLACLIMEKILKNEILVMAALISILLEMPKATRCHQVESQLGPSGLPESAKKKNFIIRIQVHPHIRV